MHTDALSQSSRQRFLGRHLQGSPGLSLQSPDETLQSISGSGMETALEEMEKNTADPLPAATTAIVTTTTPPPPPTPAAAAKLENAKEEVRVSTFVYAPPRSPAGHSC